MISFNDLRVSQTALAGELASAALRVLESGTYILGAEVAAFEQEFAAYHERQFAVGVASGTDAIELALRAAGIGRGDEVITVSHTAVPTVCAIERTGARPVLVDVDPTTYTINPAAAAHAVTPRTAAIVPVHLYGCPADMPAILEVAAAHRLLVVEDCAQAHGARLDGKLVGTFGHMGAFSFYPTKNLAACGDGGAVVTDDPRWAERLRRLRCYGQASRNHHIERGLNSRLDELQAAILRVKLAHLDEQITERRDLAQRYTFQLRGIGCPTAGSTSPAIEHAWHLYVIRDRCRDALRARLLAAGVETQIHYAVPIHLQPAYADLGCRPGSLPVTERICGEILSLPFYPGLNVAHVENVVRAIHLSRREAA
jgi:dTDP-4-amino-4,6-dideoxygalactose transaminase